MPSVLIADDAAFMRMMLKNVLTEAGYEVVGEAENGAVAVSQLPRAGPDLTTMDITMPEMDGLAALKEIRAGDPDGAGGDVLGDGPAVDGDRVASRPGRRDFIVKPFQADRVRRGRPEGPRLTASPLHRAGTPAHPPPWSPSPRPGTDRPHPRRRTRPAAPLGTAVGRLSIALALVALALALAAAPAVAQTTTATTTEATTAKAPEGHEGRPADPESLPIPEGSDSPGRSPAAPAAP